MDLERRTVVDALDEEPLREGFYTEVYPYGEDVLKICPASTPDTVRDTLTLLDDAAIPYPDTTYATHDLSRHGYHRHTLTVQQDRAAPAATYAQDHGYEAYRDAVHDMMHRAATHGYALDATPDNLGVLDGDLVYLDVQDPASTDPAVDHPMAVMRDMWEETTESW